MVSAPDPETPEIPRRIETPRLFLRPLREGDGAALNEAVLETWDALHRWMPWAKERPSVAQSEESARLLGSTFVARTDFPMSVFLRDGGTLVGGTGLHRFDWSVPRFEIGYWVRRSCEGKGYVTETVRALTRFALTSLKAERVEIRCSHRNLRSQRVAERCGFQLDGRLRNDAREPSGELRDTLVYSLVRADSAAQALMADAP